MKLSPNAFCSGFFCRHNIPETVLFAKKSGTYQVCFWSHCWTRFILFHPICAILLLGGLSLRSFPGYVLCMKETTSNKLSFDLENVNRNVHLQARVAFTSGWNHLEHCLRTPLAQITLQLPDRVDARQSAICSKWRTQAPPPMCGTPRNGSLNFSFSPPLEIPPQL